MTYGSPTKNCPRCNTLLPAQAPYCGTCGMQFSAPGAGAPGASSGTNYGAPQYGGQGAPGGWPQSQPTYQTPSQPTYQPASQPTYQPPSQPWQSAQPGYPPGYAPQGQPGPDAYAPAAVLAPPRKGGSGKLIAIILIAVIVVGGGIGGFLYFRSHTTSPSSPLFDRHGLQSNVPLPDNVTFVSMKTITETSGGISLTINEWIWTVSSSAPSSVQQYYQNQLPSNGWTQVQTSGSTSDTLDVSGCQSNQVLFVGASLHLQDSNAQGTPTGTVDAPQGGTALGIALSSNPEIVQLLCAGTQPTP